MTKPADVIASLEDLAPLRLAADWDNVGLLVATKRPVIHRVMTCLTLTIDVAREAVSQKADLVVTHHPLPFRPVNRITEETPTGAILVELVTAGIGVWSGHTAWDSAAHGINAMLAEILSLQDVAPLEPDEREPNVGFGRMGTASSHDTVDAVTQRLISTLGCPGCSLPVTQAAQLAVLVLSVEVVESLSRSLRLPDARPSSPGKSNCMTLLKHWPTTWQSSLLAIISVSGSPWNEWQKN